MGKFIDLKGKKFGMLFVVNNTNKKDKSGSIIWLCKCDCGNLIEISTSALKRPERKSCGCLMNKHKSLLNKKFGKLKVIEELSFDKQQHSYKCICKCDCGNEIIVNANNLTSNKTLSCGCYRKDVLKNRKKHGDTNKRLYHIWNGMKQRCYNEHSKNYTNYGKRGIKVCDEWLENYLNFKQWALKNGYRDDLSIDRINNNKGYYPENCRWETAKVQANNTRNTKILTINNKTLSLQQWSEIVGIKSSTILARLNRGWSKHDSVFTPLK